MKLRILLLMVVGAAGVGASYALAATSNHGGRHDSTVSTGTTTTPSCQRAHVFGTTSAPQTFTVTVGKSDQHSSFAPGQVVTITVGGSGQAVVVAAAGCANGSTLTAKVAQVAAFRPMTTMTTTTATTSTGTTTTTGWHGKGDGGGRHHRGHH